MTQQWTRDDLPSLPYVLGEITPQEFSEGAATYRSEVLAHLNAHHPKPYADAAEWLERALNNPDERMVALDEARIEANIQRNRAERERDAAVARAEKAERDRDKWEEKYLDTDEALHRTRCERDQYRRSGDEWRECHADVVRDRDEWKARVKELEPKVGWVHNHSFEDGPCNEIRLADGRIIGSCQLPEKMRTEPAPTVTRADIEKCVYGSRRAGRECDKQGFVPVHVKEAVGQLCDLFGVEAEQAVDPLLDKAQEFAALADWELTDREAELLHTVAAHVLGQEDRHVDQ